MKTTVGGGATLLSNLNVTTHVVRLKLFRLKSEGGRRTRLPYFDGEIAVSRSKHGFKVYSIPAFPNSLQPTHLSSYT